MAATEDTPPRWGGAPGMVTFTTGGDVEVWWCPYTEEHFMLSSDALDDGACSQCGHSRRDRHLFICSISRPPA